MKHAFKTSLSLLLALLLLVGALPMAFAAGDPVHIATAEDFTAFVAGDASADAVLDANIDIGEWTTAFTDGYSGNFDGAGHTITYTKTNPTGNFHSLFKVLSEGGVIKNLTIDGSMTFNAARTNNAPFVYENYGTIENCVNNMSITLKGTKNCQYIGGIAAKNYGTVKNCINNGDISVRNYAGGIVYQNLGGTVTGCTNNGSVTVTNTAGYAGGIVAVIGAASSTDENLIENCVNAGAITGGSGDYGYAGGVVGQINIATSYVTYNSKPAVTIRGCSNTGTLTAGNTDDILAKNNNEDNCTLTIEAGAPVHVHTYGDGVETTPATCGEAGVMTFTCTSCDEGTEGHSYTEPIPATGKHTPGDWQIDPNESSDAFFLYCTVCGHLLDSDDSGAVMLLSNAKQELDASWFRLKPTFGEDTNVNDMVSAALEKYGYSGITVSVASAENPDDGTAAIADDGTITYFYDDPSGFRPMWFASIPVTFTLTKGGKSMAYETTATVNWDADKARDAIETQVASKVTADAIKGNNASLDALTTELKLPKAVLDDNGDKILWSLVSWESSRPGVLLISDSDQSSADTLFAPYRGILRRPMNDIDVTLTATFSFQRTAYDEAPITVTKTFDVTVKGTGDEMRAWMQQELDEKYTADKLTYMGTKAPVDPTNVTYDIQLLLPKTAGITDPQSYTFTVTSSDDDTVEILGARAWVYRPLPGEDAEDVTLTVEMQHKDYSDLSVTKEITLTVAPITEAELAAQLSLMDRAKAALFDGFNRGANESPDAVTANLSAFYGVIEDESGDLQWQYTYQDQTDTGISAVSLDPFHPSEQWDRFQSSDPDVITHENLLVTPQKENTTVTIYACLSSTAFERYAERYPDDPRFDGLYRQNVALEVTVPGTDPTPVTPDEPDAPADDVCPLCGRTHAQQFPGPLVAAIHGFILKVRDWLAGIDWRLPNLFPLDRLLNR